MLRRNHLGVAPLLLCLVGSPWGCKARPAPPAVDLDPVTVAQANRGSALRPPPRQAGPPRPETAESVDAARGEAKKLADAMLLAGVAPREVASVADTRGYRLFRTRRHGAALAWFERAIQMDPTYELSLYNAARCAALLGDTPAAIKHLYTLQRLNTPLSRGRMAMALRDPDLVAVRQRLRAVKPPNKN